MFANLSGQSMSGTREIHSNNVKWESWQQKFVRQPHSDPPCNAGFIHTANEETFWLNVLYGVLSIQRVVLPGHPICFWSTSLRSISLLTCQKEVSMGQHTPMTTQVDGYLSAPALAYSNQCHVRQCSLIDRCWVLSLISADLQQVYLQDLQ